MMSIQLPVFYMAPAPLDGFIVVDGVYTACSPGLPTQMSESLHPTSIANDQRPKGIIPAIVCHLTSDSSGLPSEIH